MTDTGNGTDHVTIIVDNELRYDVAREAIVNRLDAEMCVTIFTRYNTRCMVLWGRELDHRTLREISMTCNKLRGVYHGHGQYGHARQAKQLADKFSRRARDRAHYE